MSEWETGSQGLRLVIGPWMSGALSGVLEGSWMSMQSSSIWEKTVTSWPLKRLYFGYVATVEVGAGGAP